MTGNLPTATRGGTGPGKRLETCVQTQTNDCLDEQRLRTGIGDKGEQSLRSAQQEDEEGPAGSNHGRTQRRVSSGKVREEAEGEENARGEYTDGAEDEPEERQGQMAPQSRGSQRLTHEPHTQSDTGGALPVEEDGNGNQNGKAEGQKGQGFYRKARWDEAGEME